MKAYAPRLATVHRAQAAATALGATAWHLLPPEHGKSDPRLYWKTTDGTRVVLTLAEAERRVTRLETER